MDESKGRVIINDLDREEMVKEMSQILMHATNNQADAIGNFFKLQAGLENIYLKGYKKGVIHGWELKQMNTN